MHACYYNMVTYKYNVSYILPENYKTIKKNQETFLYNSKYPKEEPLNGEVEYILETTISEDHYVYIRLKSEYSGEYVRANAYDTFIYKNNVLFCIERYETEWRESYIYYDVICDPIDMSIKSDNYVYVYRHRINKLSDKDILILNKFETLMKHFYDLKKICEE